MYDAMHHPAFASLRVNPLNEGNYSSSTMKACVNRSTTVRFMHYFREPEPDQQHTTFFDALPIL